MRTSAQGAAGLGALLRGLGKAFHKLLLSLRTLFRAAQHVRTKGQSTRTRAKVKARRPRRCEKCGQPLRHSADWRDHYELDSHDDPYARAGGGGGEPEDEKDTDEAADDGGDQDAGGDAGGAGDN